MSGDSELLTPTPEEPPPVKDAAPPITPPAEEPEPDVIEIPTGEKLVPLSALEGAREKAKAIREERDALKAEAGKTAEKDAKIQQLEQQLQALAPKAQAYDAAVEAQSRQPQPPAAPTPEQTAKLERVAKSLDFYKTDGTLDLKRAQDHLELVREEAAAIAHEQVAPFQQQTIADKASFNLQRALITKTPDGVAPDPEVLKTVWARLDPTLTATPAGAAQAWAVALGHSAAIGKLPAKTKEQIPPPLDTERAGGRDVAPVELRESDRRIARDLGMTDKEYAAELAKMPQGWGKGQ